jgi:hypothetical protein
MKITSNHFFLNIVGIIALTAARSAAEEQPSFKKCSIKKDRTNDCALAQDRYPNNQKLCGDTSNVVPATLVNCPDNFYLGTNGTGGSTPSNQKKCATSPWTHENTPPVKDEYCLGAQAVQTQCKEIENPNCYTRTIRACKDDLKTAICYKSGSPGDQRTIQYSSGCVSNGDIPTDVAGGKLAIEDHSLE